MVSAESAHTLKITLNGIEPNIWRRFRVPSELTLESVHHVIQYGMGWQDCHLHQFEIAGDEYGKPDRDLEMDVLDERKVALSALVAQGSTFVYLYDFGDGWEHTIEVEEVAPSEEPGPICLAAERACPPEDCGGPWGYPELLAALADREHPDHEEMVTWVGDEFDPEFVDFAAINRSMPKRRKR